MDLGARRSPFRWGGYLLLLTLVPGLFAQTFRAANPGPGSVPVSGFWQFHTGDDLAWADPQLDDSGWEQLSPETTWGAQTHPAYTGFAWYRRHIEIDGAAPSLSVLIPPVDDAYDLYWNGQKIGSYGGLPPDAQWWANGHSAVYTLPPGGDGNAITGVLALRTWKSLLSTVDPATQGGLNGTPLVGERAVLEMQRVAPEYAHDRVVLPRVLIASVVLIAGIISLLLFFRERTQWMYLWLGMYLIGDAWLGIARLSPFWYGLTAAQTQLSTQFSNCLLDLSLWFLLLTLFGMHREPKWLRRTVILASIYLVAQAVDVTTIYFWGHGSSALPWLDAVSTCVYTLLPLYIFFIIGFGLARSRQRVLWPLTVAASVYGVYNMVYQLSSQGNRYTGWTLASRMADVSLTIGAYHFNSRFLLDFLLFVVLLITVARKQLEDRRTQSALEIEVRSAREIQHVLIPEEVPAVPGLHIASIYRPAEEVGGDFFQVIPQGEGALILLGDVSGKGLKAAMTVSLIVGTLRTFAEFTSSPAQMLSGLNRRLLGRIQGGFATCLAVYASSNGDIRVANAGHLPPFHDGKELAVDGALPLGLEPGASYREIALHLKEGESLTLYTDGILEARNGKGDLFGFERLTQLISGRPELEHMVQTACDFGQEDDITVLRVTRIAASEPVHGATLQLSTQIGT